MSEGLLARLHQIGNLLAAGYLPVSQRTVRAVVDLTPDRLGHFSDQGDGLGVQRDAETRALVGVQLAALEIRTIASPP